MHTIRRTLLFSIAVGAFSATALLAQHGGGFGARNTPLPSSTALGAGALSAFPSSTSRASAPAVGSLSFGRRGGAPQPVYGGSRGNSRANNSGRQYRRLPGSYVAAPYYYPLFDYSGGTDYSAAPGPGPDNDSDTGYGPDPATDAMMANQAAMGQQVQRLTAQVNDLMYGSGNPQQSVAPQPETPPPAPVTLVLKSGEQLQVQNYAVTDNTFWDFAQRGTRKIPLSSIDLAASAKATQANGGEFPQIGPSK
jgi:hypothetical protein